MDKNFGGVIWTNHALSRLSQRGIKQGDAWATFNRPEQSRYAASKGAWVYYRTWGSERIEVVAKKNERGQWLILSVWSQPRSTGSGHVYGEVRKIEPLWRLLVRRLFKK